MRMRRMQLTIENNRFLHLKDKLVDRFMVIRSQGMQRCMSWWHWPTDIQRLVQIAFGYMIEMCDIGNGHPRANSMYITSFHQSTMLLKAMHSLHRVDHCEHSDP